jgi:Zn-dependent protease
MTDFGAASPWAEPSPSPPPAQPSRLRAFLVGLISTLLLAGWIAWQMGWLWALAAVFGVFVHEFGHMMVINWAGAGPSRLRIIPFFGGAATMERTPDSEFKGVLIALAGPVFGLAAAIPFFVLAAVTGEPAWQIGAFVTGVLNFLNLAPAPPLDGSKALGPILARVHPMLERAALLIVGALAVAWMLSRGSLILPIFIGFSVLASLRAGRLRPPSRPLTWGEWALGLAFYIGALGLCAIVMTMGALGSGVGSQFLSFGGGSQ